MDINNIKIFKIDGTDWVTALDEESAKQWYANEIGIEVKDIEDIMEESQEEGFWILDMQLSEVMSDIENAKDGEPIKVMKQCSGSYAVWISFKDWLEKRFSVYDEFEPEIICSTEY